MKCPVCGKAELVTDPDVPMVKYCPRCPYIHRKGLPPVFEATKLEGDEE